MSVRAIIPKEASMKKIIGILVIGFVALGTVSAKKWTNNVGFGFSMPISTIGVDEKDSDDISQIGYGIDMFYVGVHEDGFTTKANVDLGIATTKDISLQDNETNAGIFYNADLGVGWSFIHTEKMMLSLTGMLGLDIGGYEDSAEDVSYDGNDCDSFKKTIAFAEFNVGGDLFFSYRIKEHFGFFANFSARYLVAGGINDKIEWTYKDSDGRKHTESSEGDGTTLLGKFRIQPTLGVVWNF